MNQNQAKRIRKRLLLCYRRGRYAHSNLTTLGPLILVGVSSSLKDSKLTACGLPTFQAAILSQVWI